MSHMLLVIIYHILKEATVYTELGGNYFEQLNPQRVTRYLVRRLENLGHKATLEPLPEVA